MRSHSDTPTHPLTDTHACTHARLFFHIHQLSSPLQPLKIHGVFEDADQTINPTGALCAAPTEFNVTTLLQTAGGYISEKSTATEHIALLLSKNVKSLPKDAEMEKRRRPLLMAAAGNPAGISEMTGKGYRCYLLIRDGLPNS